MRKRRSRLANGITVLVGLVLFSACASSQGVQESAAHRRLASQSQYLDEVNLRGPERNLRVRTRHSTVAAAATTDTLEKGLRAKYAALLDVAPQLINNLSLYRFIDEWYGVRYLLGGDSKDGIDCSAFVQKLYEHVFGVNLVRTALEQAESTRLISDREHCQAGDLVFFKTGRGRISHVGLYLINNFFVHASSSQGVVITSLNDAYWSKHFACAGRVL